VNDVTRTQLEYAAAESNMTRAEVMVEMPFAVGIPGGAPPIRDPAAAPEKLMAEAESPAALSRAIDPAARDQRLDLHALDWHAKAQHAAAIEQTA